MGASITFDDSHWPLLISRFQGAVTSSEYEEYLARGAAYLQRGELYVSVLDMEHLLMPTVAQRQRQAEWLTEHATLMRERVLGCALIITSPFIRLALSAVLHVRPLPSPYVTVHDMVGGVRWTVARLEAAGLLDASMRVRRDFGL